jgi:AcrR family transcriptional regulator
LVACPIEYITMDEEGRTLQSTASAIMPQSEWTDVTPDSATNGEIPLSQRSRLIDAIVHAVSEKGYSATTLGDIVSRARVSRSTFYDHFANKAECFVAALHTATGALAERVVSEVTSYERAAPKELIAAVIRTYCDTLAAEPDLARIVVVDPFTVDAAAVAERDDVVDTFASLYRGFYGQAREQNTALPQLSDDTFRLIPDAIIERTRRIIARGEIAQLPSAAGCFIDFVYHVLGL